MRVMIRRNIIASLKQNKLKYNLQSRCVIRTKLKMIMMRKKCFFAYLFLNFIKALQVFKL